MAIVLFFERLALISCLSALVLAILWPHIGPRVLSALDRIFVDLGYSKGRVEVSQTSQNVKREHPKFSGRLLRRTTSEKESLRSAYRSFQGLGQSPLAGAAGPGYSSSGQLGLPSLSQASNNNYYSTMSLTLFTATILALIIYTLMKMFSARFSPDGERDQNRHHRLADKGLNNQLSTTNKDLWHDKRKLASKSNTNNKQLSREQRARELILQHGGKNVSSAIRLLAGELEKQKRLLYESLTCPCSCHYNLRQYQGPTKASELGRLPKEEVNLEEESKA